MLVGRLGFGRVHSFGFVFACSGSDFRAAPWEMKGWVVVSRVSLFIVG